MSSPNYKFYYEFDNSEQKESLDLLISQIFDDGYCKAVKDFKQKLKEENLIFTNYYALDKSEIDKINNLLEDFANKLLIEYAKNKYGKNNGKN